MSWIGFTKNLKAQIGSLEQENRIRIKWNTELERRLEIAYEALSLFAKDTWPDINPETAREAIRKIHSDKESK